jgi:hypoxanthine phosphoribosyltransferase
MEKIVKLISQAKIRARIRQISARIDTDYLKILEEPLLMICVLKGAFMFAADLIREIEIPVELEFILASSYGSRMVSKGKVNLLQGFSASIKNRHILIVEDVVDTGLTLQTMINHIKSKGAKTIKTCSLLDKTQRHKYDIKIDYLGFSIPDRFVVGYGIDFNQKYRQLSYIAYVA